MSNFGNSTYDEACNYRIAALVLQHEQQIKDIAAHLLAGKTLDAAIDRELVLKTGIPVDDCNQVLSLMEGA